MITCHMFDLLYFYKSETAFVAFEFDINVRPAFFYTKAFVYNSMAIRLIMTKLLHPTI